eukprot:gene4691-5306_t
MSEKKNHAKHSSQKNAHKEATPGKGDGLPKMNCIEYFTKKQVDEGLKSGKFIEGVFRINQKNFNKAYLTPPNSNEDILIEGMNNRNRALHGDIVVVEILESNNALKKEVQEVVRKLADEFGNLHVSEKNQRESNQVCGRVVYIREKKHSRCFAGLLKQFKNGAYGVALLSPMDSRLPRVMIPIAECPENFQKRPQDFQSVLFAGKIENWKRTCGLASGKLVKSIGNSGDIEPETEGFLIENSVDYSEFPEESIQCLPTDLPWKIPALEYERRRDLRKECIFTIDPATARDLDDALSCRVTEDGNFEVGVHIADVSYFIEEDNALDKMAASRATSVYLVQKVIPMLPRLLCEQLCSLNPAEDRLTYSVMWTITPEGKILNEWFGRSVIRSCCKLTYEHAQEMIETEQAAEEMFIDAAQFPSVDGAHDLSDIHAIVRNLFKLSAILREKRFDSGALLLNQPKLSFTLDGETGLPNGCKTYVSRDSNRLVEEFMLLANMAVAHRLMRSEHQDLSLLRRHPSPNAKMLDELSDLCKRSKVALNISNSKSLHNSLQALKTDDDEHKAAIYSAVVSLCSKPMQLAKYFCAGAIEDASEYHHFALNVPLYTHFTSPIRRYADIMVHRLLSSALDENISVKKGVVELQQQAEVCNDKKAAAKRVQELSGELFLNVYVRQVGELYETAVVIGMLDSAVDVLLLRVGLVKRVYCNSLPLVAWKLVRDPKDAMQLTWRSKNGCTEDVEEKAAAQGRQGKSPSAAKAKNGGKKPDVSQENTDVGPMQVISIFDRVETVVRSESINGGAYKINVYFCRPDDDS